MKKKLTPPTKKALRLARLRAHVKSHPNDKQSATHLTHPKWDDYR